MKKIYCSSILLTPSTLCNCILCHCLVALAHDNVSIINVTVMKPANDKNITNVKLNNQPAFAKTAGRVKAPVPTIKLKT